MDKKMNKAPSRLKSAAAKKNTHPGAARLSERVEIDHTVLDLFVDDNGNPVRPTLTAVIDQQSRMVAGFYLGFPEVIAVDNGREFHGEALATVISSLGDETRGEASGKPRRKSRIEQLSQELLQRGR
jgi:hypothetical protein